MAQPENGLVWVTTFDQGVSKWCTLYAISSTICEYGKKEYCRLKFKEIHSKLLRLMKLSSIDEDREGACSHFCSKRLLCAGRTVDHTTKASQPNERADKGIR